MDRLQLILDLYNYWLELKVPVNFATCGSGSHQDISNQAASKSAPNTDRDVDKPQGKCSDEHDKVGISTPSTIQSWGGWLQDDIAFQSIDVTAHDNDWNSFEEITWIKEVNWAEKVTWLCHVDTVGRQKYSMSGRWLNMPRSPQDLSPPESWQR